MHFPLAPHGDRRWSLAAAILAPLLLTLSLPTSGCGFFEELGDDDDDANADDEEGDDDDEDDDECGPENDRCIDQDIVRSCDLDTGKLSDFDCAEICGSFLNVSCIEVVTGQHGCWCVEASENKQSTCGELEACLERCTDDVTGDCGNACFGRVAPETARLFGALLSCVEQSCTQSCRLAPNTCDSCRADARQGLRGNCAVERRLCDDDDYDDLDEIWP